VVVTGTFAGMPRKEIEAILVASGATLGSSVTKKTQLLIVGTDAGSKLEKAEELGVEIMECTTDGDCAYDWMTLLDGQCLIGSC
jgi:DNA ligase (NAD+)